MLGESSRLGFKFPPFVWFFGQVTKIVFLTYNGTAKPHLKLVPEDFVRRHADDLLPRFLLLTKQMVNVLHSAPLPGVSDGVLPENHHLPEGETCSYRFFYSHISHVDMVPMYTIPGVSWEPECFVNPEMVPVNRRVFTWRSVFCF